MQLSSAPRRAFDLDELASGALKGWLSVTGVLALWMLLASKPMEFLGFAYWELRVSVWLVIATIVLGVPFTLALHRHLNGFKSWVWGLAGALVFTVARLLYAWLSKDDSAPSDIFIMGALSGTYGALAFYFAKRQSDRDATAA
jgi:hypothetical protein